MAAFKDGDNSTDPRRCTAQSRQSGKRCKNASIPGGRICRFHGGAAPHVQKKAVERLQALEHPAIDVLARFLTAPELATMFSTMLHPSTVLNAAKIVLDRTGHKPTDKLEIQTQQTLDVTIFSTGLLRQMGAELRAHEARNRAPLTPGPPADDRPED
jgi:hypothetical protein